MLQHHNCLYCGKELKGIFMCGCDNSKLARSSSINLMPKHKIKPLYKQDLIFLSKELPVIPNVNHEKLIMDSYIEGGWEAVVSYCDFVYALEREMGLSKPDRGIGRKIIDFVVKSATYLIRCLRNAYNHLKR